MKFKCSILDAIFLGVCFICGASAALAQGTDLGTIRGTVTDPRNAVLANVPVQVTDSETGTSRDLTTNEMLEAEPSPPEGAIRFVLAGVGLKALGKTTTALAAFERALKIDPQNELAKSQLAELKGQNRTRQERGRALIPRAKRFIGISHRLSGTSSPSEHQSERSRIFVAWG